jgi:S1-C subfamily serine protease
MTVARLCSTLLQAPAMGLALLVTTQSVASAQASSTGAPTPPVRGCQGSETWNEFDAVLLVATRHPVVSRVQAGSPAALAGMQVGDSVLSMNGVDTMTPLKGRPPLSRFAPGDTLLLILQRGTQQVPASLVLGVKQEGASEGASVCVPFVRSR